MELRRRTDKERIAYLEEKLPSVMKKFNITEEEARQLLMIGATAEVLAWPTPRAEAGRSALPDESSVAFIWHRPDDETAVMSIQLDGGTPEEIGRANYDRHGTAGIELARETLKAAADAIGARWVEL